ncbi:hypothetical protein FA13DRAFT_1877613 [Coprinellus micaceus]|uniref:DUF6589 domain-containing protein n=1 Tax=Coprinellus micaceus TaxID=71717 RepID=A0A4Y7T2R1_COPMI|nr:hypothetical protein FA13DRAFT_1877613 [Coprinellus micaceus]
MTGSTKRKRNQAENSPVGTVFQPYDPHAPKKTRRVLVDLTPEVREKNQREWAAKQKERDEEKAKEDARRERELKEAEDRLVVESVELLRERGHETLFKFLKSLYTTRDQQLSGQVSKMVGHHAEELLEFIQARDSTAKTADWVKENFAKVLASEMDGVTQLLRPQRNGEVSVVLDEFSLEKLLENTEGIAPNLRQLVSDLLGYEQDQVTKKKKDVVLAAVLSVLAQCRNEKSSQIQTVTGIFLFACGASKALFDVLNHSGFCLSYTQTIEKLKDLSNERLELIRDLVRRRVCLIVYDNVNIAFRVGEQTQDSKDHFDNGTTATLIPLYDVDRGELPLSLLPPRVTRRTTFDFDPCADVFPAGKQVEEIYACMVHHAEEIFLDAHPEVRKRLGECPELDAPMVQAIPIHKTEQYPLPAALIDESTIDGTLDVIDHIFFRTLKLSEDEIRQHGIFFCSRRPADMCSSRHCMFFLSPTSCERKPIPFQTAGSRRDDSQLADNPSKFTKPVMGLFHAKIAGTRCVVNEHFGTPNSKAEWLIWKLIALLGWKHISAGWKTSQKQQAPYQLLSRLVLRIALVANMLDGFRLYCGKESLEEWVVDIKTHADLRKVSVRVVDELASSRRVEQLRAKSVRDLILENIILFNRDALLLRSLQAAIKRGDIGTVVNVLTYWMIMFRGTGKMPKYADILFSTLTGLKKMHPMLKEKHLQNWLINLSGKKDGFKELDLLQEHHNFWLKIIYAAKGSNKSWKWLSLVSTCLFALRDVIRQVQKAYKTPFNSTSHTHPSAAADIRKVCKHCGESKVSAHEKSFHTRS